MTCKSLFTSRPALALAAILAFGSLSLATDAFAKGGGRGGGGGGGHGGGGGGGSHGGGGGHVGGGLGGGGGGLRSGTAVHSGGLTAHPGFAVRSGAVGVHRGVAFHRPFVHHRFIHRGFRVYSTYGCYRWRRVLTPFGWRLRHVNVCSPYHQYYY
jgi:hypothetical protein